MTVDMTAQIAFQLREPFDPKHVGKLPRVYCKACRDAQFKVCQQHTKRKCRDCGNNITDAHLHLDYVGHAEITDRLLHADPTWTWEPAAFGPDGLPLRDQMGGLWIRLTVAGVTRLGYGHADGKTGPDAVKEAIGDALRNAAMRFGVALDLWGATFKDGGQDHDDQEPAEPEATAEQVQAYELILAELQGVSRRVDIGRVGKKATSARDKGHITLQQFHALDVAAGKKIDDLQQAEQTTPAEDRTAEPAEDPEVYYHGPDPAPVARAAVESTQQPMGAHWPEPRKPGSGDPA